MPRFRYTHVWVWWLTPDLPLPRVEREALDVKADRRELFISAISLWEMQVLYARKRLDLPLPFPDWLARAADDRVISVMPLSVEVVLALDALPESFRGDPADRVIVATARAHAMPLATHDGAIRRSRTANLWRP